MQDILAHMGAEGYSCNEDSILRYIKQLRNELGIDVISSCGRNARYFIGNRLLEKEEMKLIILIPLMHLISLRKVLPPK